MGTMLSAPSVAPQHTHPINVNHDKVQVLEDLEALVALLISRASDAECTASSLQKQVTSLHAAADQSSKDQAGCNAQLKTLNKEAGIAKRVLAPAALLCIKCSSASMLDAYQASDQTCKHSVPPSTCPVMCISQMLSWTISHLCCFCIGSNHSLCTLEMAYRN